MILPPKSTSRHPATLAVAAAVNPTALVPAWLRHTVSDAQSLAAHGSEDIAITAGAALAALDAVVRRQERFSGAWRQRLALSAAAATAKQAGRVEDEKALRDAVLLTKPGDDVGPAGRLLFVWRRLAVRPAADLLTEQSLGAGLEAFGYARNDEGASDLAAELRQLSTTGGLAGIPAGAFTVAQRHGFGPILGAFIADALLAQRLGWSHAIPLLGTEAALAFGPGRSRRPATATAAAGRETEADRTKSLLAAQARAALRAIDLFGDLERRADRLTAVAPKLRAKGAGAIVERLLNEDALLASRGTQNNGISERGLRRLFDRLVELGAVRELSGRSTFRIYGL